MENKHDIGKAFREKLDGLQRSPSSAVWDAIRADLPQKKKGFLFLLWEQAGSTIKTIALLALVVLTATITYVTVQHNVTAPAVNSKETIGSNASSADSQKNNGRTNNAAPGNAVVSNNEPGSGSNTNENGSMNSGSDTGSTSGNTVSNSNSATKISNPHSNRTAVKNNHAGSNNANNSIKNNAAKNSNHTKASNSIHNNNSSNNSIASKNKNTSADGTVAANRNNVNNSSKSATTAATSRKGRRNAAGVTTANNIVQANGQGATGTPANALKRKRKGGNKNNQNGNNAQNALAATNAGKTGKNTNNNATAFATDENDADDIDSIANAKAKIGSAHNYAILNKRIIATDSIKKATDSISKPPKAVGVEENLEVKTKSDKKSDSIAATNFNKWYAFAHVAPTQFMFPKNKSLLDPLLNGNTTSTKVNYNYGAYIGYNITPKLSVRAGVISGKMQQDTKNVILHNTSTYEEPSPNFPDGTTIITPPADFTRINYATGVSNASVLALLGGEQDTISFNIRQKLEYYEIPVEATYNLFGKKVGVSIIGGASAIYVSKNSVYAQNQNGSMLLGSVKNIKKLSFSGNLGLSFYYKFLPNLQLNAEPIFKYYFNTFGNATPYTFGVQIGLQYNFDIGKAKK